MKRVPIKEAKTLGKRLGMTRVILILNEPEGRQHVVTWGKTYDDCVEAALMGNCIKRDLLGWPNYLCHAKPARQIRAEKKGERHERD